MNTQFRFVLTMSACSNTQHHFEASLVLCIAVYTRGPVKHCLLACRTQLAKFWADFWHLLVRSLCNHPNEAIINTIVRQLTARMMIACSSVEQAADLYEDVSFLPGAFTANHLVTQHKLTANGPLYPQCCTGRGKKCKIWLLGHTRG